MLYMISHEYEPGLESTRFLREVPIILKPRVQGIDVHNSITHMHSENPQDPCKNVHVVAQTTDTH